MYLTCVAGTMNLLASTCLLVLLITPFSLAQGPTAEVITIDRVAGSGLFHYLALADSHPDQPVHIYAVDTPSHAIYRKPESGSWEVFAGQPGVPGFRNGPASKALFNGPTGACANPQGALIVADSRSGCIRHISPAGVVSTLAGQCGTPGWADGPADQALFSNSVKSVVCLPNCSVVVGDVGTGRMRRIDINDPTCAPPSPPPRPGKQGFTTKQMLAAAGGSSLGTLLLAAASFSAMRAWQRRASMVEAHVQSYRTLREASDPVLPPGERRRVYQRKGALWNWRHHRFWGTGSPRAEPHAANFDANTAGASTADLVEVDTDAVPQAESGAQHSAAMHAMLGQLEPLAPQQSLLDSEGPTGDLGMRGGMADAPCMGGEPSACTADGGMDAFADLNPLPGSGGRGA